MQSDGGCGCGAARFKVDGQPLLRAFCHCTICQDFNQAEFADIVVVRTRDMTPPQPGSVVFKHHAWPPLLKRGRCKTCSGAAIETMDLPPFPGITILPAQTLAGATGLPEPSFHMFYHRRVADIDDALPKVSGYARSQLRFSSALLSSLLRG